MGTMFRLSMRQLAGRRRLVVIVLLAALPVGLAALIVFTGDDHDSEEFAEFLIDRMIVTAILPIVMMALATVAFGNELEDRTLSYLVLKPISRWRIVLPKFLAVMLVGGPLVVASGVIATLIGFEGDTEVALAVGVALLVGVVTYSAIFTWSGLMTTRALQFALVYVFLWEGLLTSFFPGIRYLSVRGYTIAIMYGIAEDGLETLGNGSIQFPAAIVGAVGVTVLFIWLTTRRLRRMDVP